MMGLCYGSWVIMKACGCDDLSPYISCGAHFHPAISRTEQEVFDLDDIDLCKHIRCPQYFLATRDEPDSWKPNGQAHKALQDNTNVEEIQFVAAPSTEIHGFMTRSDWQNPKTRKAMESALQESCDFVKKYHSAG